MELFLQFIALNYFDKQVRHQTHYFFYLWKTACKCFAMLLRSSSSKLCEGIEFVILSELINFCSP